MGVYTNIENNDYLMMSKKDLYSILNNNLNENIINEIISILIAIKRFSKKHSYIKLEEIAIKKDNILAQYILKENPTFINDDLNINIIKITNALNIALFENNPISQKIFPLFQNQIHGTKEDLEIIYDKYIIEYILNNFDFKYYIENLNGTYKSKFYIVYDSGKCYEKKLSKQQKKLRILWCIILLLTWKNNIIIFIEQVN